MKRIPIYMRVETLDGIVRRPESADAVTHYAVTVLSTHRLDELSHRLQAAVGSANANRNDPLAIHAMATAALDLTDHIGAT